MIKTLKNIYLKTTSKKSPWSIGIYEADKTTPFILQENPNLQNPVITHEDITDINAGFVADPFLVYENKFYLFFEIKDQDKNKGVIGVASSEDGRFFKYEKVVLEEKHHLSYPAVYKIKDKWYMIPEIGESNEVRIYSTDNFPYEWKYYKTILQGRNFTDPTLIFHNNLWYLFVSDENHEILEIYYCEKFDGKYIPHPKNPIHKNKQLARPAGPIFKYNNELYRFSQDCSKRYGEKVNMFKIIKLSPKKYKEKFISNILSPQPGKNWNAKKMHHICYLELDNKFITSTDGLGFK